jgi:hypothetical protein
MAQSRYWTNSEGYVTVARADGSTFLANPLNIGIESELYTRFLDDDSKDTAVEEWFAETIDAPATRMIEHLLDPRNVTRKPFRGLPEKAQTVKAIGLRVNPYIDRVSIPKEVRQAIADYVSALLVRHPLYLTKLRAFHKEGTPSDKEAKNRALNDMLRMFEVYRQRIFEAVFLLTKRVDSAEYLYADGGLIVEEPWRREFDIPFDIHAPLTPDFALQVLPVPLQLADDLSTAAIFESTNQGVARQNRIILGGARRFVFSRQQISASFILGNFGKPAPKNIGYSVTNGRLNTFYDPNRT